MTPPSYRTPLPSVVLPRFVPLAPGVEVTHHPLEDASRPSGLAHLSYRDALAYAATVGARLPTRAEVVELHEVAEAAGTELAPCILPDSEMRAAGAKPGDPAMSTLAWCDYHDMLVVGWIKMSLPDQDTPVANAGKHWIGPAPPGKAALCGWWVADLRPFGGHGAGFVQSGTGFPHDDEHHDYGTTCMLVRDVG